MIYPILAYGDPVLRQRGADIDAGYPQIKEVIQSMWDTMYKAEGVGLAAPQVGISIRLFIVDTLQIKKNKKEPGTNKGMKKVFINPQILEEDGKEWKYEEGCLSIPGVRENVWRKPGLKLRYLDENFIEYTEIFEDLDARVIQHEYDHIEGILFTDHLKPLTRKLIQKKLQNISEGKVDVDYKMKFPKK